MRADAFHFCLQRVAATLLLLRKTESGNDLARTDGEPLTIGDELREVQTSLRERAVVKASDVAKPFLRLLAAPSFSSPFKISALEALTTVVAAESFFPVRCDTEMLWTDIVDAVVSCRLVQTDLVLDEALQLRLVDALHLFLETPARSGLNNETVWKIVDKCFGIIVLLGGEGAYSPLSLCAQKVMFATLGCLLELVESEGGVGTPCVVKCVGFFSRVVEDLLALPRTPARAGAALSGAGGLDAFDAFNVRDFKAYVALKAVHVILEGRCDLVLSRRVLSSCASLVSYCTDDLPKNVLLYCTSRTSATRLLVALPLVQTLLQLFWLRQKLFVECVVVHVFLKALHQLKLELSLSGKPQRDDGGVVPVAMDAESVGAALSTLLDLVSSPYFAPSVFMSFDCDPSKPNLLSQLVEVLAHIARYRHCVFVKTSADLRELTSLAMDCLSVICRAVGSRAETAQMSESGAAASDASEESTLNPFAQYLVMSRAAKSILQESGKLFSEKPSAGIAFMQREGVLCSPLDPRHVARFLRVCASLTKEAVGSFIGELGKDNPSNVVDGKPFHAEVLVQYVRLFEFRGESMLKCLRIFLSAFRLPGEAQQIDRILVAFSEHSHSQCVEGKSGVLENSLVTYLLSFSIIMLQTDRHNPNIREDRKMTLDQFIRNNLNYGADCNQTKPLPREFLESIFADICAHPIRTEKNDHSAVLRVETWEELQLSIFSSPSLAHMMSAGFDASFRATLFPSAALMSRESVEKMCSSLRTPQLWANAFLLEDISSICSSFSVHISGLFWLVDADMFACLWTDILGAAILPHFPGSALHDLGLPMEMDLSSFSTQSDMDLVVSLVNLAHSFSQQNAVDCIMLVLSAAAGTANPKLLLLIARFLESRSLVMPNESLFGTLTLSVNTAARFLVSLLSSGSARIALSALFRIVNSSPNYLSSRSWNLVFYIIGLLRDCALVPVSMIEEEDSEFLPSVVTSEFESLEHKYFRDRHSALRSTFIREEDAIEKTRLNPSRWDDGYRGTSQMGSTWLILRIAEALLSDFDAALSEGMSELRSFVLTLQIEVLMSSTRFLSEHLILGFLSSLISACEASDEVLFSGTESVPLLSGSSFEAIAIDFSSNIFSTSVLVSPSTCAWFEMLVIETCFKNRDRLSVLWPIVSAHFSRLRVYSSVSYVNERRVIGLFKIASRMLFRRQVSSQILDLLQSVLLTDSDLDVKHQLDQSFLSAFAGHIASGLYNLFTHNVSFLPQLHLNQWKILFDLTAIGSGAGGFSSVKSFESMAWLLHEPRLRAEVPVFCISGLYPLLGNSEVPISVALGTLQLMQQLHARLEVLFSDSLGSHDSDTPLLWYSCWTPVLDALRLGSNDSRPSVKRSAVIILFDCVLDDHATAAPTSVLLSILHNIIYPCVLKLLRNAFDGDATVVSSEGAASELIIVSANSADEDLIVLSAKGLVKIVDKHITKIVSPVNFEKFWMEFVDFTEAALDEVRLESHMYSVEERKSLLSLVVSLLTIAGVSQRSKQLEDIASRYKGKLVSARLSLLRESLLVNSD